MCLSSEFACVTCLCVCCSRSLRGLPVVSAAPTDIHQKRNLAILTHKDETEKVSFFLVYIILITSVDLDVAQKSSDAVFQMEPLL